MSKKEKKNALPMLLIAVSAILLVTVGIVITGDFGSSKAIPKESNQDSIITEKNQQELPKEEEKKEEEHIAAKPPSVNVLLIGFDKSEGLTDVVMVAHVDTDTNDIKLINLPRDMMIDFRTKMFSDIKAKNHIGVRYCKLTDVYSQAGWDDNALLVVRDIAQVITGMEIDYTTAINIDGFNDVVDAVGGVEFYVPEDMNYEDDYQDLKIHLKKGLQVLDGDKAEQLVRNRKFKNKEIPPDYQRIAIQQEFLIAMSNKILRIRDMDKIKDLASTTYDLVKTDFGTLVMAKYIDYFYGQKLSTLLKKENMTILPSYGKKIGGGWYQMWNAKEVKETIDHLLTENTASEDKENYTSSSLE